MSIKEMQNAIIYQEGFESNKTIEFFRVCESNNIERIRKEFNKIIK